MSSSFDLQLENFGVDTTPLKEPATHRIFRAWLEDWEQEAIQKDCCVAEAKLLCKYKDLAFYDPDDKVVRTVHPKNLTYVKKVRGQQGSKSGWVLLGTHPDDDDDKIQPFDISAFVIGLIETTPQVSGVQIVRMADEGGGRAGNEGDTVDAEIGGDKELV